jgi:hypothetical protein
VLVALAAATAVLTVPNAAHASPSDCDNYSFDTFSKVEGGASFNAYGREVHLRNGNFFNHSFAMISASTYRRGDRVWADRSLNAIPNSDPQFPSTDLVIARGGWKQCGPFDGQFSDQVMNWNTDTQRHFAVRACFRPSDGRPSVCGNWYVDRS